MHFFADSSFRFFGKKMRTKSIRLTTEAVELLYVMAGEYQTIRRGFVSISDCIKYLHEYMQRVKKDTGSYPEPTRR